MQFVSQGDEKCEGSAAPWAEDSSWLWSEKVLSLCTGTQHRGMPCQAPTWLCQGILVLVSEDSRHLISEVPEASGCSTFELSPVMCNFVPNTAMKRRTIWCCHCALSINSKINCVGTNSVSPGLFLLPLMLLALIQLLLINFHQV